MKLLTKDLYEAAYLKAQGMKISKVFGSRNSVLMEFEGNNELDILKNKYREGRAEMNIHTFKDEMREIKDIVFSVLRETKNNGKDVCYSLT